MTSSRLAGPNPAGGFRHEAFLYADDSELIAGAAAFAQGAMRNDEPMLVVLTAPKLDKLRAALGPDRGRVRFEDIASAGRNPARLIPLWREFLDDQGGGDKPVRGIGEPIGPDCHGAELVERKHHEALANHAFADLPGFWVLCPYDVSRLGPAVVDNAYATHPWVLDGDAHAASPAYHDRVGHDCAGSWGAPLAPAPGGTASMPFSLPTLHELRAFVGSCSMRLGLDGERSDDLVLAVNELASNSIRYAGGDGTFRMWTEGVSLLCEVQDTGHLTDPLAGRRSPRTFGDTSRGLWVVNQLCDLVQIRSCSEGTVIRLHMLLEA